VRYGAALLALLIVAGYVTFRTVTGAATECTVTASGESVALLPQQAANAATIGAVASSRNLPERALAIALATAMQESELRNLRAGDRDSIGLFQQRPSQGWGTAQQIADPVYSANEFFDELVKIPRYAELPLTVAAQQVQHSEYPQAYAKREGDALLLAAALSGRVPSLSCRVTPDGRAGDAAAVRAQLARVFGPQVAPQPDATGVSEAEDAPSSLRDSLRGSVVVPVAGLVAGPSATAARNTARRNPARRSTGKKGTGSAPDAGQDPQEAVRHGWVLAQWAVAHAQDLRIAEVAYAGRVWRASQSGKGWVADPGASAADRPGVPGAPGQPYEDVRITVAR
jgi:hypothetical protein